MVLSRRFWFQHRLSRMALRSFAVAALLLSALTLPAFADTGSIAAVTAGIPWGVLIIGVLSGAFMATMQRPRKLQRIRRPDPQITRRRRQ